MKMLTFKDKMGRGDKIGIILMLLSSILVLGIISAEISSGKIDNIVEKLQDPTYQENLRNSNSIQVSNEKIGGAERFKSYDAGERTLKIEDSDFNTILEVKLLSDYHQRVVQGDDIKIAEMLLIDFDSSKTGYLDSMNSYDALRDYIEKPKNFIFKYANETTTEECFPDEDFCENVTKTNWVAFVELSELPNKNIRVGIFTDTKKR